MTLHRELGLTDEEMDAITDRLGREPSHTELAIFSVMWSEHCSYKSSRIHLETLPTEGDVVLVGPGEGAGIVEVAPGVAVAWKIESHNHPSFVEPFNGAATGIGGIVRDILSMGARPIALMDSLRFGPPQEIRSRYLLEGVVDGISSYGNSIGVPTVGGETSFHECYAENPLVNVACLGVVESELMRGRADREGDALVLIGSSTGRDGIGGASVLASQEFDDASHAKRPSVQVGDPLTEKLLIEASLELIRRGLVTGYQDLGAGGISCPVSEMAAKSQTGMRVYADRVHQREPDMAAFEIMISESQERMLAIVAPERVAEVLAVCERWELRASVIGEVTKTGRIEVVAGGEIMADVPAPALADEAPAYVRPQVEPRWLAELQRADPGGAPADPKAALDALLSSPQLCSKRWLWEQYDHMILLGTLVGPGGDASVIRLPNRTEAVAISVDGPGRYCRLDPYEGARLAVAEAARNVACTGARPIAVTNCLNFGSPERAEIMWQFAEVVRGMGDACRALGTPVTGGNVSFYNETNGRAIFPTPVIGMLGVLDAPERATGIGFRTDGDAIVLLGSTDPGDFGGSDYSSIVNQVVAGRPPALDLAREARLLELLVDAIGRGLVSSAHDLAGGGLGVALAEAAIAGGRGFRLDPPESAAHHWLYSESPSRAIVVCSEPDDLMRRAAFYEVEAQVIGTTGGGSLDYGWFRIGLDDATDRFEAALPALLLDTIEQ